MLALVMIPCLQRTVSRCAAHGMTAVEVFNRISYNPLRVTRDEAIRRLREHETELRELGVERLYLFGSTATNTAGQSSDVDLFFDYEKGKLGLFGLMEVKERAAAILGGRVDIMTRDSIHRVLRRRIEKSAVLVF